ncbi:MAG: hypothetical protein ACE5SW_08835 [Nitrososphaeraceae archaeon]
MRQDEIKTLFIKSIKNDHLIRHKSNNSFLDFKPKESRILNITDECYFRNFDLVLAIVEKINPTLDYKIYSDTGNSQRYHHNTNGIDSSSDIYQNLIVRSNQFIHISKNEKCKIDQITFYPFEIKSNKDVLDKRLSNQVLNAILTFGRSVLILDTKHIKNKNRDYLKLLPTTIIGYTGNEDYFEIISIFDRIVFDGILNPPKRSLVKQLLESEIVNIPKDANCILTKLKMLEKINQKLIFNYFYKEKIDFSDEEEYFLQQLLTIRKSNSHISDRKKISEMIKKSINHTITDFL